MGKWKKKKNKNPERMKNKARVNKEQKKPQKNQWKKKSIKNLKTSKRMRKNENFLKKTEQ